MSMDAAESTRLRSLALGGDTAARDVLVAEARRTSDWPLFASLVSLLDQDRLWQHAADGSKMVWIPGGQCRFGLHETDRPEVVEIEPFALAMHPVSNEQFGAFLRATAYRPDPTKGDPARYLPTWDHTGDVPVPPEDRLSHPVASVNYLDALHYCEWAGLTLPTTPMWEWAAVGSDGREYPWGRPRPTDELCNIWADDTVAVGNYSHIRTAWGCQDMVGQVSEWCTPGDAGVPTTPQQLLGEVPRHVNVRGSAFLRQDVRLMRPSHNRRLGPWQRNTWVGFRPVLPYPDTL